MKDISKYKFGSVEWQLVMESNIEEKKAKNIKLDEFEETYLKMA